MGGLRSRRAGRGRADETLAAEPAAEEKHFRSLLALQEDEGLTQLAARRLVVARTAGQEARVQAGHREAGVEVSRRLVVIDRSLPVAGLLAAERKEVLGSSIQLVDREEVHAALPGLREVAAVSLQHCAQEQDIRVLRRLGRQRAHPLERLREPLVPKQVHSEIQAPCLARRWRACPRGFTPGGGPWPHEVLDTLRGEPDGFHPRVGHLESGDDRSGRLGGRLRPWQRPDVRPGLLGRALSLVIEVPCV